VTDDVDAPNQDALEQAIAAFRQMSVPDWPADDELLTRLVAPPVEAAPIWRPSRRLLSLRAVFAYAAAASVLLGLLAWTLFGQTTIALADVIQAAQKHRFVRYKQTQIIDEGFKGDVAPDRTVLADLKAFRIRSETRVRERGLESVSVVIQDALKNRMLILSTDTDLTTGKVVTRVGHLDKLVWNDAVWKDFRPLGDLKPFQPLLDHLRELQNHRSTKAVKESLGGRQTVKYQLADDSHSISVWVDPKTKLPVRMENAATYPDGVRYRFAFTDFEWNPKVKDVEQLFSTEPPAGYTIRDHTREDERGRPKE